MHFRDPDDAVERRARGCHLPEQRDQECAGAERTALSLRDDPRPPLREEPA